MSQEEQILKRIIIAMSLTRFVLQEMLRIENENTDNRQFDELLERSTTILL